MKRSFVVVLTVMLAIGLWWSIGILGAHFICWCFDWEYSVKVSTGIWFCITVIFGALRALRGGE